MTSATDELIERGLRALTTGDLDALEAVLDPAVTLRWVEPGAAASDPAAGAAAGTRTYSLCGSVRQRITAGSFLDLFGRVAEAPVA
jgi:hypothetical protein